MNSIPSTVIFSGFNSKGASSKVWLSTITETWLSTDVLISWFWWQLYWFMDLMTIVGWDFQHIIPVKANIQIKGAKSSKWETIYKYTWCFLFLCGCFTKSTIPMIRGRHLIKKYENFLIAQRKCMKSWKIKNTNGFGTNHPFISLVACKSGQGFKYWYTLFFIKKKKLQEVILIGEALCHHIIEYTLHDIMELYMIFHDIAKKKKVTGGPLPSVVRVWSLLRFIRII